MKMHEGNISLNDLKTVSFFRGFTDDKLEELSQELIVKQFDKDEVVINESHQSNSMFFLARGNVIILKEDVCLAELKQGEYFGEMSLINGSKVRNATVKASDQLVLYEMTGDVFEKYVKSSPGALYDIVKTYDKRLRDDNTKVVNQYVELKNKFTELKEAHQQLLQTEKLASIGMLISGIAHEINNPLTVILAYIKMLQKDLDSPKEKGHYEKIYLRIEQASEAIRKIVLGLKTYVRMDEEQTVPVKLHETIQGSIDLMSFLYKKENIEIVTDFGESELEVMGNVGQFQQVIINLLSNAKDAMESVKKKSILITTRIINDEVHIGVKDTGHGIAKENMQKVFQKFWTTKGVGKGTGLGLDIVKKIVDKMNGRIEIDSELNVGTTFTIVVPKIGQKLENLEAINYKAAA
ncbi:MAG: cyclic nucleotide-binding domain-containing protein [Oligoflexia bacterium]|nr:cyclic nucleotide-binding domain-containing protein [Oligoflexia bacterium]MBF0366999.1 cyclic nucleotide-binding domain-containing protein [Oligoflexia bacterium]